MVGGTGRGAVVGVVVAVVVGLVLALPPAARASGSGAAVAVDAYAAEFGVPAVVAGVVTPPT